MAYTYPPAAPTVSGDLITINRFLNSPTVVAQRLRTLLQQRYISDTLLSQRMRAEGGAIQYESGETLFGIENPRAISPGGEYPLTTFTNGIVTVTKTVKWGQDTLITDEAIARQRMTPVTKALSKMANQNVKFIDSVALAVIASAVTATQPAAAPWATATGAQILRDVMTAKTTMLAYNEGFDADTVVCSDAAWMNAMLAFVAAGYTPRESVSDNSALTGEFPVIAGLRWLATPNLPTANQALVIDSGQLGGMADEDIGGPGYASASDPGTAGVQVKVIREEREDQWRLRARRITVPVVLEPKAAIKVTGVGV